MYALACDAMHIESTGPEGDLSPPFRTTYFLVDSRDDLPLATLAGQVALYFARFVVALRCRERLAQVPS